MPWAYRVFKRPGMTDSRWELCACLFWDCYPVDRLAADTSSCACRWGGGAPPKRLFMHGLQAWHPYTAVVCDMFIATQMLRCLRSYIETFPIVHATANPSCKVFKCNQFPLQAQHTQVRSAWMPPGTGCPLLRWTLHPLSSLPMAAPMSSHTIWMARYERLSTCFLLACLQ